MIEIDGLNYHQRILADILWNLQTFDQIQSFLETLDDDERQEANTVMTMMTLAVFDQEMGTAMANAQLKRFML
jgi:hypothetical protein